MPGWLATVVAGLAAAVLSYALGFRQGRRAEKRAERAERRERRAEKRDCERLERERRQDAEEEGFQDFVAEVDEYFEDGGRSFPVEPEDRALGMRAVEQGLFDHEWKGSGKLVLRRRTGY